MSSTIKYKVNFVHNIIINCKYSGRSVIMESSSTITKTIMSTPLTRYLSNSLKGFQRVVHIHRLPVLTLARVDQDLGRDRRTRRGLVTTKFCHGEIRDRS